MRTSAPPASAFSLDQPSSDYGFSRFKTGLRDAADFLPIDGNAVHSIHQPIDRLVLEHEKPIPFHHEQNRGIGSLRKLSGKFLRKIKLAFNGKLSQDIFLWFTRSAISAPPGKQTR
jgi:hypothetical protein